MNIFNNIEFANPWFFTLLLLLPIYLAWLYFRKEKLEEKAIPMPGLSAGSIDFTTWKSKLSKILEWLKYLAFIAMIIALARPQSVLKEEKVTGEGIDIILIMDLSSSMLAQDFKPDRLSVSKEVASLFIDKRPYDRIGLVVFSGESFTQSPLTTDHQVLKDLIEKLECGIVQDGTAIGMGLASAVNRLKDSDAKSKIAILLTDGVNNAGYIKPITAAEIARELGIKTYTIGVGSRGLARSPISKTRSGQYRFGMSQVNIDEKLLNKISNMTSGKYYRATSRDELESIYAEIDKLEKSDIEVTIYKRYTERFRLFLWIALISLLLWFVLRNTVLRVIE